MTKQEGRREAAFLYVAGAGVGEREACGRRPSTLRRRSGEPSLGTNGLRQSQTDRAQAKHGTQLIRAAPGRWNAKAGAVFLAELRRTGCVRWAARACGFSTNALYKRRENYPEFAARWAAAKERIPALLSAATIASLDSRRRRRPKARARPAQGECRPGDPDQRDRSQ